MLAGVVASSPLVLQTFPASKVLRFIGGKASAVFPNVLIDAPIVIGVSVRVCFYVCLFHSMYAFISDAYSWVCFAIRCFACPATRSLCSSRGRLYVLS